MSRVRSRLEGLEIPQTVPGFRFRPYEPGDEAAILDAFNEVFAEGNPAFVSRGLARWRWQYAENPFGRQVLLAIDEGTGVLAGHYAGVPRPFGGGGREGKVSEAVDSFVVPRFRRALRRPGLFVVLAEAWFRTFTGGDGSFFAYGLPIETAARIGAAFLGYQIVHQQLALECALDSVRTFGGPEPPAVSVFSRFDPRFDGLWERVGPELGFACPRTTTFLEWRFRRHPDFEYRVLGSGNETRLDGYLVWRRGIFDDRDDALLVDFLVPKGDVGTMRALLRALCLDARASGASRLTAVLPPTSAWFLELQRLGFTVRPTKYDWSVSHNRRPFETHSLRRAWWYTLADTDLA